MKHIPIFLAGILFTFLQVSGCSGGGTGSGGSGSGVTAPAVSVNPASATATTTEQLGVTITVSGANGTPTGSVVLSSGSYTSSSVALSSGSATITIPAGSLAAGTDLLTATYTPDGAGSADYKTSSGYATVSIVKQAAVTPTVTVTPDATTLPSAQSLDVTVAVSGSDGTPTGSVVLSSGTYMSFSIALSSGSATFYVLPGSLATGSDTLTVTYSPDGSSAGTYGSATGAASIDVTAPGNTSVAVTINTLANRHEISQFIYGNNDEVLSDITDVGYTYSRWGGNDASNYNWILQTRNAAADYYFEDYGGAGNQVNLITQAQGAGSHALTTMAMMDWVAQSSGWSFPVHVFGAQCATDPNNSDAGDGLKTDCQTPVTTAAQTGAYYPLVDTAGDCPTGTADGSTCVDRQSWAQALAAAFNGSSATCSVPYSPVTSCHFYDMDNEPDIWNGTHRDVHPSASGYDELADDFETEGTNLKTWDSAAVRFGPVFCCWWFYWNGANDADKGNHGGVDFLPWWLNQVYWMDKIGGARTLDVYDIHAYADCGPSTNLTDAQLRAATVACSGFYWDPSTVNQDTNNTYTTNEEPNPGIPFIIPRMKALVNEIYPDTPLSFTEWGAGLAPNASWDFSTALLDADTLGVFGREGLSFASRWGGPTPGTAEYLAWKMFTNYDGNHDRFGSISVSDTNNVSSSLFTSYASLNSSGNTLYIMVLNKDPGNTAQVTFNLNGFSASTYTAYTLASTASGAISASSSQSWSATQSFAPYSITLLVVSGSETSTPASEWYLNPDDLMIPASGTATLHPAIVSGSSNVTLTSAVFDAFEGAPACSGSLTLTNATITSTTPATITANAGSTSGYCHYTVTGSDSAATQTKGGWIVVGNPPATLTQTGNNQSGAPGSTLTLSVTLNPGSSGGSSTGAGIFFTTSAGALSNGTSSGTSVIATTNSSGVATVTLTLPSSAGPVTVTAQDQFALGGQAVTFTETAN